MMYVLAAASVPQLESGDRKSSITTVKVRVHTANMTAVGRDLLFLSSVIGL